MQIPVASPFFKEHPALARRAVVQNRLTTRPKTAPIHASRLFLGTALVGSTEKVQVGNLRSCKAAGERDGITAEKNKKMRPPEGGRYKIKVNDGRSEQRPYGENPRRARDGERVKDREKRGGKASGGRLVEDREERARKPRGGGLEDRDVHQHDREDDHQDAGAPGNDVECQGVDVVAHQVAAVDE